MANLRWVATHVFCASLEALLLKFSSVCSSISYYPNQLPVTLKNSRAYTWDDTLASTRCRGSSNWRLVRLAVPYIVCTRCTLIILIYFVSTDKASDVVVVLQFCTVPSCSLCPEKWGCVSAVKTTVETFLSDRGYLGHEVWSVSVQSLKGKRLVLSHRYWTWVLTYVAVWNIYGADAFGVDG